MLDKYTNFAHLLIDELVQTDSDWVRDEQKSDTVNIVNTQNQVINLNLTPFTAIKNNTSVGRYFKNILSINALIDAYKQIKIDSSFESSIPEFSISGYANDFIDDILYDAKKNLLSDDVKLIVDFVKELDCYSAMKSIESFLYSRSDLELLRISKTQGWNVHFDHLAIRCGSSKNDSAKKVVKFLIDEYGYSHPQIITEKYYLFDDGWSAYPLYKILSNGQVLRIFVDQSEASHPNQIIQHWNQIYGFTAHHLAIRVTEFKEGIRKSISLPEIIKIMIKKRREVLTPTGYYTNGLLTQVFTKPEKNFKIPVNLLQEKKNISLELSEMLLNAKLLEIVSRKEMSAKLAAEYYGLYDIEYNSSSALHSAVYYQYFLPAQAAHVIKSSVEI